MIRITGRNFKLSGRQKEVITEKLSKFESFLSEEDDVIEVVLERNTYGESVEISFRVSNRTVRAEVVDRNLFTAVDIAAKILQEQIRRYSEKLQIKDKDSIRLLDYSEATEEKPIPKIIRRKYITSKPMNEEEAILQMELLGHKSFLFLNTDIDSYSMLYKRNDGNYGIIEAERLK